MAKNKDEIRVRRPAATYKTGYTWKWDEIVAKKVPAGREIEVCYSDASSKKPGDWWIIRLKPNDKPWKTMKAQVEFGRDGSKKVFMEYDAYNWTSAKQEIARVTKSLLNDEFGGIITFDAPVVEKHIIKGVRKGRVVVSSE